jgi:hypothetical protein
MSHVEYDESIVDKLAASTARGKDENPLFRYTMMSFNSHGPLLVSEIQHGKIIENLLEDGSKTKALMHDMNTLGEYCLSACGSIDGQTLDKFLIKRAKIQQIGFAEKAQSSWSKWFGGGGGDGKNDRGHSGF